MQTIAFSSASREIKQLRIHAPEGEPKAVIQILHGMAEHSARYLEFADFLQEHGYAAAIYDMIGCGPETPSEKLGHFGDHNGWQRMVYDIDTVHTILVQRFPGVRQVLFGHSMGSFLAREYAIQFPQAPLHGLILSATGWKSTFSCRAGLTLVKLHNAIVKRHKPSPFLQKVTFAGYNKGIAERKTSMDWLCRDPQVVQKYLDDPLCGFPLTGSAYEDLLGGLKHLSHLQRLTQVSKSLPVLLFAGSRDSVADQGKGMEEVARQYREAGLERVDTKLYPGGRHEMLNGPDRKEVMADILTWLNSI